MAIQVRIPQKSVIPWPAEPISAAV